MEGIRYMKQFKLVDSEFEVNESAVFREKYPL
jgi:hypothetical protein